MSRSQIGDQIETLRHFVIAARRDPAVEQPAEDSLERLRQLYSECKAEFTSEDLRWIRVLMAFLRERLEAHRNAQLDPSPSGPRARRDPRA